MKVTARKRLEILARIRSGESTASAEARRVGVDERTIRRYMAAEGVTAPGAPAADVPPVDQAPPRTAPPPSVPGENPRLEEALRSVGAAPPAPSPSDAAAAARSEDIKLALETVCAVKGMAVYGASLIYAIPDNDPILGRVSGLIEPTKACVVANAAYLADMIRRNVGGPYILAAALALDALVSWMALKGRALQLHPPRPKEEQPRAAPAPAAPEAAAP